MIYLFIIFLSLIFFFIMPFNVGTNTFFSLAYKQLGGNIKFGAFSINFSIKSDENGIEILGIKKFSNRIQHKKIKKIKNKKKLIKFDINYISKLYIENLDINFCYGSSDNAFKTAMICNSVNIIIKQFYNSFSNNIKRYNLIIQPNFNRDYFYFQFNVIIKLNILIIFSLLFKIILLNLNKIILGVNNE